jgi:hypothetical protein
VGIGCSWCNTVRVSDSSFAKNERCIKLQLDLYIIRVSPSVVSGTIAKVITAVPTCSCILLLLAGSWIEQVG